MNTAATQHSNVATKESDSPINTIFVFGLVAIVLLLMYHIIQKDHQITELREANLILVQQDTELKTSPPILSWIDLKERGSFRVEWRGVQDLYETSIPIYVVRRITPRSPGEGDTMLLAYGLPQNPEAGWTCAGYTCEPPSPPVQPRTDG